MRHPHRNRKLKPKHRRTYTPTPRFEYDGLREKRTRQARRCLVALTATLVAAALTAAVGAALCIFR